MRNLQRMIGDFGTSRDLNETFQAVGGLQGICFDFSIAVISSSSWPLKQSLVCVALPVGSEDAYDFTSISIVVESCTGNSTCVREARREMFHVTLCRRDASQCPFFCSAKIAKNFTVQQFQEA